MVDEPICIRNKTTAGFKTIRKAVWKAKVETGEKVLRVLVPFFADQQNKSGTKVKLGQLVVRALTFSSKSGRVRLRSLCFGDAGVCGGEMP